MRVSSAQIRSVAAASAGSVAGASVAGASVAGASVAAGGSVSSGADVATGVAPPQADSTRLAMTSKPNSRDNLVFIRLFSYRG